MVCSFLLPPCVPHAARAAAKRAAQMIKQSTRTWLSYAFAADVLINKELTSDDVKIESFTPASTDGKFEFTVSVKEASLALYLSVAGPIAVKIAERMPVMHSSLGIPNFSAFLKQSRRNIRAIRNRLMIMKLDITHNMGEFIMSFNSI